MNANTLKLLLIALIGSTLSACDNDSGSRTNLAPTITDIADVSIEANEQSQQILFQVDDEFTDAGSLSVTASTDNPGLIDTGAFEFGVAGGNRSLQITPISEMLGASNISINFGFEYCL